MVAAGLSQKEGSEAMAQSFDWDLSRELLLRVAEGDVDAMASLVTKSHRDLLRFLGGLLGDKNVAKDCLQESWFKIVKNYHKVPIDLDHAQAWILRIVKNAAMDHGRDIKRSQRVIEKYETMLALADNAVQAENPEGVYLRRAESSSTHRAGELRRKIAVEYVEFAVMSRVKPSLQVYYRIVMEGRQTPHSERAVELDVPLGTYKNRIFHAEKHYSQLIEERSRPDRLGGIGARCMARLLSGGSSSIEQFDLRAGFAFMVFSQWPQRALDQMLRTTYASIEQKARHIGMDMEAYADLRTAVLLDLLSVADFVANESDAIALLDLVEELWQDNPLS
jgi:DNA-directed RNA polymerase specialized sigma24 family protein